MTKLIHIKSRYVDEKSHKAKVPNSDQITYGEIAVNYAKNHEMLSIKNDSDEIVTLANQVEVGSGSPKNEHTEIFIDETEDSASAMVYTKDQVDSKITAGNETSSTATSLLVDETVNDNIEVYTKAEVDAIIAALKKDNNLK